MRIANLTPHPISILVGDRIEEIKPAGFVLRVQERVKEVGSFKGIRLVRKELDDSKIRYEDVERLKEIAKEYDVIVISLPCKELIKKMLKVGAIGEDVAKKCFIIGSTVRDENGKVAYADALSPIL